MRANGIPYTPDQAAAPALGHLNAHVCIWCTCIPCLQAYGFWRLFCEFMPTILHFVRRVPLLGKVLDYPVLKTVKSAQGKEGAFGVEHRPLSLRCCLGLRC